MTRPEDVISVADLSRRLKRAVEAVDGGAWVEGEVASLRRAASGHVYFALKDEREEALIDCVMYRFQAQRARRHLFDGARVQLKGRATLWVPRGRLQLVAEAARPAGRGALLEALERLKKELQREGLFDEARKRPLPPDPRVIGLVTSAHGAALHDIVTVAFRRGAPHLVLSPALVQGDGAPESLIRALDKIERYPRLDVLIVGRGGGSGEDLMAFNDERVIRRLARMSVPVVSAVGHEIDVTLTDLVADVRAATPSQAAELVVIDRAARVETLAVATRRLGRSARARLVEDGATLERLRNRLGDPRFLIAEKQQGLDELELRLERAMARAIRRNRAATEALGSRLSSCHPRAVVARAKGRLGPLTVRLHSGMRTRLSRSRVGLDRSERSLEALSPLAVLERGYAIVTRPEGTAVRRPGDVSPGDSIRIRVREGSLGARVTDVRGDS